MIPSKISLLSWFVVIDIGRSYRNVERLIKTITKAKTCELPIPQTLPNSPTHSKFGNYIHTMSFQTFPNQVEADQRIQGMPCQQQELPYHQDAGPQIAWLHSTKTQSELGKKIINKINKLNENNNCRVLF